MLNETLVIAFAFILFIVFTYKPVKAFILSALDQKIADTIKQVEEAKLLKKDATKVFQDAQDKLEEAENIASQMISNAKKKAEEILHNVEKEVTELAAKKTESSMQRILLQEKKVLEEIKVEAVELAMSYVEQALIDELDKSAQLALIESNVASMKKVIH
jgi:F-type H+-transporting ATPase subunit b